MRCSSVQIFSPFSLETMDSKKGKMASSQFSVAKEYIGDYMKHCYWKENAAKVSDDEEDISGKIVIVTGSNTGIGKMVALQLAKRKAVVIMAIRDLKKGQEALDDIKKTVGQDVTIVRMKIVLLSIMLVS